MWIQFICLNFVLVLYIKFVDSLDEITVPLKFGSKELMLTFPPTAADADHMSTKFCNEKGMEDGVQFDSCYASMYDYLLREIEKHNEKLASKNRSFNQPKPDNVMSKTRQLTLTITLEIVGVFYNIEYKHQSETAQVTATRFCVANMEAVGVTPQTLSTCVEPVASQLTSALSKQTSASSLSKSKKSNRKRKNTTDSNKKSSQVPDKIQTKTTNPSEDIIEHKNNKKSSKTPQQETKKNKQSNKSGVVSVSSMFFVLVVCCKN
jgi:hypothetical protein